jgi:hypothetical protein
MHSNFSASLEVHTCDLSTTDVKKKFEQDIVRHSYKSQLIFTLKYKTKQKSKSFSDELLKNPIFLHTFKTVSATKNVRYYIYMLNWKNWLPTAIMNLPFHYFLYLSCDNVLHNVYKPCPFKAPLWGLQLTRGLTFYNIPLVVTVIVTICWSVVDIKSLNGSVSVTWWNILKKQR